MDKREQLRLVFEDTQKFYTEDPALAAAVADSRQNTHLYEPNDYPKLPILGSYEELMAIADDSNGSLSAQAAAWEQAQQIANGAEYDPNYRPGKVSITRSRTFEAAMRLHREHPDKKIAVLNFASATRPGGGVKSGSSAQEEALCRCSTLYPTLDRRWLWQKYYDVNRAASDARHTDACIYSPGIIICKTDESVPKRMKPEDWVTVDVISCAAPNLRKHPSNRYNPDPGATVKVTEVELFELHVKRAQHILTIAAANKVDIVILGAFGCGAFCNDPNIVAKAYHSALAGLRYRFDLIEFAIYDSHDGPNYTAFKHNLEILQD